MLRPVFEPIAEIVGKLVFSLPSTYDGLLHSDSVAMYVLCLFLVFISLSSAAIWTYFAKGEVTQKTKYIFIVFLRHYLALTLLKYGFDKIFLNQFQDPEANLLYTKLGLMNPDILYWSSMGTSPEYSIFTGLMEVVPAILLLFRRTAFAGSLMALFVLMNVVMINFGFDITVKLYSLFLLLLSFLLIFSDRQKLFDVFGLRIGTTQTPLESANAFSPRKQGIKTTTFVLLVFLLESVSPYLRNQDPGGFDLMNLNGAWLVTKQEHQYHDVWVAQNDIRRVFFHSKGYFIVENFDGTMQDCSAAMSEDSKSLILKKEKEIPERTFEIELLKNGTELSLSNNDVRLTATRVSLEDLPLRQRTFHWTSEGVAGQ